MAMAKVFKNRVPNCKVFHPNGRQITFIGGKHITQIEKDIKYLESLVAEGDPHVYIDPEEHEVDTEELTPEGRMAKIKREAIQEFLAEQARAANMVSNSVDKDKPQALNAGTSATLVNAMESTSAAGKVVAAPENTGGVKVSAPKK